MPPFYLRTLVNLKDSLNAAVAKEKESKDKMNASNARALTAVKQKIKKISKEFEAELKRFQEVCPAAPPSRWEHWLSLLAYVGPRGV